MKVSKIIIIVLSASLSLTTVSTHAITAIQNSQNQLLVDAEMGKNTAANNTSSENCADPDSAGSMGETQKKAIDERKKIWLTNIDMQKVFNEGDKAGCFAALSDFPDLSVNIPTLSSILNSLKQTLMNYATRKVCNAVNNALDELIGPLNDTLDDLSDRGQLDLTGQLNREMSKKLYEIDPELARSSKAVTDEKNYEFNW